MRDEQSLERLLNCLRELGFELIDSSNCEWMLEYFNVKFVLNDYFINHCKSLVIPEITKVIIEYDSDVNVTCGVLMLVDGDTIDDIVIDSYKIQDILYEYYKESEILQIMNLYRGLKASNDEYHFGRDLTDEEVIEISVKKYQKYLDTGVEHIGMLAALYKEYINTCSTVITDNKELVVVPKYERCYRDIQDNIYLDLDKVNKLLNEKFGLNFRTDTNKIVKLIDCGI